MKKLIYLSVFVLMISACKKKDDPEPVTPPVDKTSMISTKWECDSVNAGGICNSFITLNTDGTGLHQNGAFSYTITWYFINNQAGFHMKWMYGATMVLDEDMTIEKLTDTEFNYYQPSTNNHYYYVKF